MLLFIAKGRNKQQHYGSPPEVGEPAHPRSFCKQNSLPGLPSRPHCVSDSSVPLRVTWGASRGLRPPLRGPLRGRARRFRHSPLRASAPSCARPAPYGAAKTPCPPPYRVGRRGFAPIELFCRLSPAAPLAAKNSTAPPPDYRLDRGWRPHFALSGRLSAVLPACGQRWQSGSPVCAGSAIILKPVTPAGVVQRVVPRGFL